MMKIEKEIVPFGQSKQLINKGDCCIDLGFNEFNLKITDGLFLYFCGSRNTLTTDCVQMTYFDGTFYKWKKEK